MEGEGMRRDGEGIIGIAISLSGCVMGMWSRHFTVFCHM